MDITNLFKNLLKEYMPRANCMFQEQELIALHMISDGMIAVSYIGIGLVLLLGARKLPDFMNVKLIILFGLFIFLCGITHIFDVFAMSSTYYKLDGWFKFATAVVSVITFLSLPEAIKRFQHLLSVQVLIDEVRECNERARIAEQKADMLLEQVRQLKHE